MISLQQLWNSTGEKIDTLVELVTGIYPHTYEDTDLGAYEDRGYDNPNLPLASDNPNERCVENGYPEEVYEEDKPRLGNE